MKTQLLIARHGNTFHPNERPRRVGARTDLPLVELKRSQNIGAYLKHAFMPDITFSSPLQRTRQTAYTALETAGLSPEQVIMDDRFKEIDYGVDENQPEDVVVARIGEEALEAWNARAEVPPGWKVNPQELKANWLTFAAQLEQQYAGKNILVVTSNGVARFSPVLCQVLPPSFSQNLKVSTGSLCLFEKDAGAESWVLKFWNEKPLVLLKACEGKT